MNSDTQQITAWAQETLNELFREYLIPFELIINSVKIEGAEYVIGFQDSRLNFLRFSWTDNRFFREAVRFAILGRIARMDRARKSHEAEAGEKHMPSHPMIHVEINKLLGDRSYWWLAATAQINYSVVMNLATHKAQRITYSTLYKLCGALKCQPGDLLVMLPDAHSRSTDSHTALN
jgi:DNA-binding Xre family transcriptional regulator